MTIFNHWKNHSYWEQAICHTCNNIYDPKLGDEAQGVPPKTPIVRVPDDWRCECGASKRMYRPLLKKNG